MTFDIPGLTKDLIDEYEGHRSHNDEMQKYRDEHFSEYKEKRPVSEGTFSYVSLMHTHTCNRAARCCIRVFFQIIRQL